ncbi:MAG TPA: hypothetical protein VGH04_14545 [Gemmatimonadaceae bacterium]
MGTSFVEDRAAVKACHVRGCSIDHDRIENGFFGIYLTDVTDCRVADNVIRGRATRETEAGNGVHLVPQTARGVTPMIEFRGVAKSFGAEAVLRGFDVNIQCGRVVGLVGPPGAGKTTHLVVQ